MSVPHQEEYVSVNCPRCGAPLPSFAEQVMCPYCGSRLLRVSQVQGSSTEEPQLINGIHLTPYTVKDPYLDCDAYTILIPQGWQFTGGVYWRQDNPGTPSYSAFTVQNPKGYEAFEGFPNLTFTYTNNPMTLMLKPVGSIYFGNEVRPPMSAVQAMRDLFIPRFRGRVSNLQIISLEAGADLSEEMRRMSPPAPNQTMAAQSARLRIRYEWNNVAYEEESIGVCAVTTIAMPGMFNSEQLTYWSLDFVYSFRTKSGMLDQYLDLSQTIAHSLRLNPQWYAGVKQVSMYMIQNQIQHIRQIGQISRIISQTHNQISDMQMQSFYERQQAMDKISTSFSQYMRGVDEFYDPYRGMNVELPTGYQNAWANSLGEYIITDNPNYNPNIGSNLTWELLTRKA